MTKNDTEKAAEEAKRATKLYRILVFWLGAGVADYLCGVGIYLGSYLSFLIPAATETAKFASQVIFFPVSATASTIYAVLAWRTAFLDRNNKTQQFKNEHLIRAAVSTMSALLIVPAVIVGIVMASSIGMITAAIYGVNLGITGIYNFLGTGYHFYHAWKKKDALRALDQSFAKLDANNSDPVIEQQKNDLEQKRVQLREEISAHMSSGKSHLAVGATTLLIAIAGAVAVLGGYAPFAVLGIVASVIGAAFFTYALTVEVVKRHQAAKAEKAPDNLNVALIAIEKTPAPTPKNQSTLQMMRQFSTQATQWVSGCFQQDDKKAPAEPVVVYSIWKVAPTQKNAEKDSDAASLRGAHFATKQQPRGC